MSELKKLTRLGGDVRRIAALLQAKAPKGEMLAYINPQEAALLKAYGGSGKPHADTGIPSYQLEGDYGFGGYDIGSTEDIAATSAAEQAPATSYGITPDFQPVVGAPQPAVGAVPVVDFSAYTTGAPAQDVQLSSFPQIRETPAFQPDVAARGAELLRAPAGALEEPGVADQLSKATGLSKEALGRLGLAGVLGTIGAGTAGRAREAGQAGKAEMQQLARPYQAAGAQAVQAAQRGELLPVGQQSLQATQAQLAQGIQQRGGVGAQQAAAQIEALRQQLLQQQYDYGLKLSGIGDNIALGAIRTGMQADQYVNQLTNQFYSNMAYIASGMTPGVRTPTQGATA